MNNEEKKTKEKILSTTLEILKIGDIKKLSIRKIAEKAEVNSAAISYYFKSKEFDL